MRSNQASSHGGGIWGQYPQNCVVPRKTFMKTYIKKTKSCLTKNAFCTPKLKSCLRAWLKKGVEHTQCYASAVHIAKIQGCANVLLNSRQSEVMQRGWGTSSVHSLKLVNYTRIENAHKVRKKFFMWLI